MDILFNALYWYEIDEKINNNLQYSLKIFGRTENDKSITVRIEGINPFFYVRIPQDWNYNQACKMVDILIQRKQYTDKNNNKDFYIKHKIVNGRECKDFIYRQDLYAGFTANKKFKFIKIEFLSLHVMKSVARFFDYPMYLNGIVNDKIKLDTYESKLSPFIRFIHRKNINSTGWIILPKDKYEINDIDNVTTEMNVKINCNNVEPYIGDPKSLANFKICSFDIECMSIDGSFPQANREHDKIISICSTFNRYGSDNIYKKHAISLKSCNKIDDVEIETYETEQEVLLAWKELIEREDPDIITGYNIFFFDMKYMNDRAKHPNINCIETFSQLSRIKGHECKFEEKILSSSGLGDNIMHLYNIIGRIQIDLFKLIQRDYKLNSYKLDKVAENFMKEKILNIEKNDNIFILKTNTTQLQKNNYIKFEINDMIDNQKFQISFIEHINNNIEIVLPSDNPLFHDLHNKNTIYWCLVKDDISPQEMFNSYNKGSKERSRINQYCVQDCALVTKLLHKLEFITNYMSMGEVCFVPLEYIIMRGQGIKSLSLVTKTCTDHGFLIKDIKNNNFDNKEQGYEGATVLEPKKGFYSRPIAVLDFNSLYPNSEISCNMSHETLVKDLEYDNLEGYKYHEVTYIVKDENGIATGTMICRYAQKDEEKGIIPTILTNLLAERKIAKKMMEKEQDPFKKKLYDGKQLALKVTANSIYGQLGASTSPIYCKEIAASTTAFGRKMLELAKDYVEKDFTPIMTRLYECYKTDNNIELENILDKELQEQNSEFLILLRETILEIYENYITKPIVIYGDTDSNFNDMCITHKITGEQPTDIWCRKNVIKLGIIASKFLKIRLPKPQNMEYEKVYHPFSLMAKKRYIGNKYEMDPNKYKRSIMGYTLKRRDNANIVHKIVGNLVDILMDEMDIEKTIMYIKKSLQDLLDGKYPITDFITSKTLRAEYKGIKKSTCKEIIKLRKDKYIKDKDRERKILELKIPKDRHEDMNKILNKENKIEREKEILELIKTTNTKTREKGDPGQYFWDDVECSVAHVKMCQRMKERDNGNIPQVNDRIPFVSVYIYDNKKLLQGDKIEHPDYIIQNNLKIDYLFYITNQIMNPSVQFLELLMDDPQEIFNTIIDKEQKKYDKARLKYIKESGINKEFTQYGFSIFNNDLDNSNWDIIGPENIKLDETDIYNTNIKIKKKNIKSKKIIEI
jgi:DNA polymerase elongation subunit (family B)